MIHRIDLYLGEVVYISIIFYIPTSRSHLLNVYDVEFWWRDNVNQPLTSDTKKENSREKNYYEENYKG